MFRSHPSNHRLHLYTAGDKPDDPTFHFYVLSPSIQLEDAPCPVNDMELCRQRGETHKGTDVMQLRG